MAVANLRLAMQKLEKDGSTEETRTAASQHEVHCIPAERVFGQCFLEVSKRLLISVEAP